MSELLSNKAIDENAQYAAASMSQKYWHFFEAVCAQAKLANQPKAAGHGPTVADKGSVQYGDAVLPAALPAGETETPRSDAAAARCEKALELFNQMPPAERAVQYPELSGRIVYELLTEARILECELARARAALRDAPILGGGITYYDWLYRHAEAIDEAKRPS